MILRAIVILIVALLVTPAFGQDLGHGLTCADVRKLTAAEIVYWKWRFKITAAQVRAIKQKCGLK